LRRRHIICGVLTVALTAAGCGGDSGELKSIDSYLKTSRDFPKVRPDGRLTQDPPPLTAKDVNREPEGSPRRTVLQLLLYAQTGHPGVVSLYEPQAQRSVALENLIGSYALARPTLAASWPRFVQEIEGEDATTLDVLLFTKGAPPVKDTFVLRQSSSGWRIAYDTLLARWLAGYLQGVHDFGKDEPSRTGIRTGQLAAKGFRDTFVRSLDPKNRQTFLERESAERPDDDEPRR